MKFVELKKHLSEKKFLFCYNLVGDDSYLISLAENMFFANVAGSVELNRCFLSAENLDKNTFQSAINTTSFFCQTKLVVLRDVVANKNKTQIGFIKEYLQSSANDFTVLVIVSDEKIFDDKFIQSNAGKVDIVDCNRLEQSMVFTWINSVVSKKGKSITRDAISKLVDYTNCYLSKISVEIDKLINFITTNTIEVSDVETMVVKDLEYSVFELTESLGHGNEKRTYEILSHMMQDKKAPPSVFAMISNYFRRMFFSVVTAGTDSQIASQLGVKEFAIKKTKMTAGLFSKQTLKAIVDLCTELDLKIKSSQITYVNAIDYLVMFILTNKKSY